MKKNASLPESLRPYFWDVKFEDLEMDKNKHLIIKRVLDRGEINDVKFIIKNYGIEEIKNIVLTARDLARPTGNFWADILDLNKDQLPCLQKPYSPIHFGLFS